MAEWSLHHLESVEDDLDGSMIEVFLALDNRFDNPHDAMVIRTSAPGAHVSSEVWIGANAVKAVVSALMAHRPGQLQLFDQDAL